MSPIDRSYNKDMQLDVYRNAEGTSLSILPVIIYDIRGMIC